MKGITQSWYVGKNKIDDNNLNQGKKYWQLISFNLNLKKLNPFQFVEEVAL